MASMLQQNSKQIAFKIKEKKCYTNWDAFCVQSLETATDEIHRKRVFRYSSMDDNEAEEARLRHVTQGIVAIQTFIKEHGWKIFVVVAVSFAVAVGGAAAAAGGAVTLNPIVLIGGGIAAGLGTTVASYYGYKLYKHKALVIKVKGVLVQIKTDFNKFQPGNTQRNAPKIQVLLYNSVKIIIEKIYEVEIMVNDLSLPIDPICLCGAVLRPKLNTECYGNEYSYVICDVCDQTIKDEKDVYHCPQRKNQIHPRGYDVCIKCARDHNEKFKRYHAVIIQALPEVPRSDYIYKVACKDAKALESLFKSLNYHEIIVVKQENANKEYIKRTLKRMSLNNKNDVVVVCYSGHGLRRDGRWMCWLDNHQTITDQEIADCIKGNGGNRRNESFGATCDIVLLLNACHSGYFNVNNQSEQPLLGDDEKMPQYLSKYDNLGKNFITIAACESSEEGNFVGEVSPFFRFTIEELQKNKHATPQSIHKYIYDKSNNSNLECGIKLSALQNVQRAYEKGKYALYVPLIPAVKKY